MFIPACFVGSELVHQCLELLLASIIGVVMYYITLCVVKWWGNIKTIMFLEPVAMAIAAGVVLFSCFAMLQPHLPAIAREGVASPHVLYFLSGVAAGGGLVLQAHHYFGDVCSNAATAAMLAHGTAEGIGLGLLVSTPAFAALFQSQVLHGVPEGMLVATASLERSGLLRTLIAAALARAGQTGAFYVVATYSPVLSDETVWAAEGVAFGSVMAMMWQELVQPAEKRLGKIRLAAITAAAAVISFILFGEGA